MYQIKNTSCYDNYNYDKVCYFDLKTTIPGKMYGKYVLKNGNIYIGYIENGKPHGYGECIEKISNITFEGIFNKGILSDQILLD
jgi:hypothetical protein